MADPRRQTRFLIDQFRMGNCLGILTHKFRVQSIKQRANTPIGNEARRAGDGQPSDEPINPGSEVRSLESTTKRDE